MKKSLIVLLLILLSIPLVACNSNSDIPKTTSTVSADTKDLSNYPEGVQNGTVSPTFYDEVKNFVDTEMIEYSGSINRRIKQINDDPDYFSMSGNYSKLLEKVQDGKRNLNKMKFHPTTEADEELYDAIIEAISHREISYNYLIEFSTKNDYSYFRIYKDDYKTIEAKYNYILDMIEEFKLGDNI